MSIGLRQQILGAESVESVQNLLKSGDKYEFVNEKTRRAWKSAAARRTATLKGEKPPAAPVAPVDDDVIVIKAKRKKKL